MMARGHRYRSFISLHIDGDDLFRFPKYGMDMLNGRTFLEQKDPYSQPFTTEALFALPDAAPLHLCCRGHCLSALLRDLRLLASGIGRPAVGNVPFSLDDGVFL